MDRHPRHLHRLHRQELGDAALLAGLFEFFAAVLDRLCHLGSAYDTDPAIPL